MFKVFPDEKSVRLEMSIEYFSLAIRVGKYIDSNFLASDMLTISNVSHVALTELIHEMKKVNLEQNSETLSIKLDGERFRIFSELFYIAGMFEDEDGFEESYDQIDGVLEVLSRATRH